MFARLVVLASIVYKLVNTRKRILYNLYALHHVQKDDLSHIMDVNPEINE